MGAALSEATSLVIRGGTIVDGSGGEPFEADIAVVGGRIAEIGRITTRGDEEIDARNRLVTPGFVDVHTHYDGQATWSNRITPSSWNGVTTTLIGNCGVGFAPCKPAERDILVKLMEGVEDLPEVVLTAGLPWAWESFPEYLDFLDARSYDLDIATQVPHAAVRVYAMGQRGADREPATEADRAAMARIAVEGVRAGALGFSTSRTIAHRTLDGGYTPTLHAAEIELATIGAALGELGAGWMQVISDFDDVHDEMTQLRRIAAASGRPMAVSLLQRDWKPEEWRIILDSIDEANAEGVRMIGQTMGRPIGLMFGFELTQHPFMGRPTWQEIAGLPFEEKLRHLRDPAFRARLLSEQTDPELQRRLTRWEKIFPMEMPLNYEPSPENSIAAIAERTGADPQALCYDLMLEQDGHAILNRPVTNYANGSLDAVYEMMRNPNTILGLSDGGAHVGFICDASAPTTTLLHWTRDRTRGPKVSLPWMMKRLTRDCATAIGLQDRGLLAPGYKADINVIDYDNLSVSMPEMIYDMPANGKRLIQRTTGYDATVVSGVPVQLHGEPTGRLPGRLVRGGQTART
jgi:N-acyl-D-aspartate/D-glutamate deacylase